MRKITSVFALVLLIFYSASSFASRLPAEHEAARLMLAVEASIKEKSWAKAQTQLQALADLKVPLPAPFYYFNGVVLTELSQLDSAQTSLEDYVIKAEEKGEYYVAALELLTQLEEKRTQQSNPVVREASIKPAAESSGDGYVKSLQALYLTDDPIKALVMQINSLLSVHAYTGNRVKKATERSGIRYSLSVSERDLVLQEKQYLSGQPELSVNKLNVLGVDPFLKSGCASNELMCWIYHPGNGHERWILIDRDDMVLNELVEAFSKLIRLMQK